MESQNQPIKKEQVKEILDIMSEHSNIPSPIQLNNVANENLEDIMFLIKHNTSSIEFDTTLIKQHEKIYEQYFAPEILQDLAELEMLLKSLYKEENSKFANMRGYITSMISYAKTLVYQTKM